MCRRVHQGDVQGPHDQSLHLVFAQTDLAHDRYVRRGLPHPANPSGKKILPRCDALADPNVGAITARKPNIVARLLQGQHQRLSVLQELMPHRRETVEGDFLLAEHIIGLLGQTVLGDKVIPYWLS